MNNPPLTAAREPPRQKTVHTPSAGKWGTGVNCGTAFCYIGRKAVFFASLFRGGERMAEQKAVIMDADGVRRALTRIAFEIVEKNKGVENLLLAGVRTRGVFLAARIAKKLGEVEGRTPPVIDLDVTPWRDDKPRTDAPLPPARPAHRRRDRRAGGRCALHRAHGARCYRSSVPRRACRAHPAGCAGRPRAPRNPYPPGLHGQKPADSRAKNASACA